MAAFGDSALKGTIMVLVSDERAMEAQTATTPHDDLRAQIAEAAYFKAQERGFEPGFELDDWLEAEAEVLDRESGGRPG
jgi:hypothetical protein